MAQTERLRLLHKTGLHLGKKSHVFPHLIAAVADNEDDLINARSNERLDDVIEHRFAAHRQQGFLALGGVGHETLAFARHWNNDFQSVSVE